MPDLLGGIIGILSIAAMVLLWRYAEDLSDGNVGGEKTDMKYQNKEHTDRVFAETARRLDMPVDEFMNRPFIEIAKIMADQGVTFGLQEVK